MDLLTVLLVVIVSYVIGSFPSAYLAGRWNGINIFELGSGNMGATNTLRTLGLKWALVVLAIDLGKGVFAVFLSARLVDPVVLSHASASVISAVAVVVGHNWSLFASLLTGTIRGGKGAATAAGTWLILMPVQILFIPVIVMVITIAKTRYMSLGVLLSVLTAGILIGVMIVQRQLDTIYVVYYLVGALIVYRFRDNIKRLLAGNERRIGDSVQI
ncbi:MAG: glycerol-3-phosphate acyltransferase [Anaerolineae bacterium]|nr:glycerol-3-phosphate acyltransferase [Anaerolineae bacterium]